ncbi:hypothetical protein C8Q75DRAFT_69638 [Abortiporus biennis]|nr:hypothetical protein C8Q75DRAFT_69638 [Abortiporus biennis]
MAELPGNIVLPKLDNTLGSLFIGVVFAAIFYGVTCVQTYIYFTESMELDRLVLKAAVGVLWVLDSLDLAFIVHVVYFYTVKNYFNPTALLIAPWSAAAFNVTANLNDVIIRGILVDRIWKVSKNIYLVVALWIGNFVVCGKPSFLIRYVIEGSTGYQPADCPFQSGFSLALSIKLDNVGSLQKLDDNLSWLLYAVFVTLALEDTLIAIALCAILWARRTGFSRTDTQIQTLMRYSIHTGALTSLAAILIVITFASMRHNFVYIGIYLSLPKLYFNALLAILNARKSLRAQQREPSSGALQLSGVSRVSHFGDNVTHQVQPPFHATTIDMTPHSMERAESRVGGVLVLTADGYKSSSFDVKIPPS